MYLYEVKSLKDELKLVYKEQYHVKIFFKNEYMYFKRDEDSGEYECELRYKEDGDDNNDNKEDENQEEEWYEISVRKFVPDPVLPLYISSLSWDTPPNPAEIGSSPLRLEQFQVRGGG